MEDYHLLLRLCAKYPASFESRSTPVGVYNWHADRFGSFAVRPNDFALTPQNQRAAEAAIRRIEELKAEIRSQRQGPVTRFSGTATDP